MRAVLLLYNIFIYDDDYCTVTKTYPTCQYTYIHTANMCVVFNIATNMVYDAYITLATYIRIYIKTPTVFGIWFFFLFNFIYETIEGLFPISFFFQNKYLIYTFLVCVCLGTRVIVPIAIKMIIQYNKSIDN